MMLTPGPREERDKSGFHFCTELSIGLVREGRLGGGGVVGLVAGCERIHIYLFFSLVGVVSRLLNIFIFRLT